MTEAEFQSDLIEALEREHHVVLKLDPGTGNIPVGWPDLVIIYGGGYVCFCEVKVAGGKVSMQQRRHMELLCLAGHKVCFVDPRPGYQWPRAMSEEEIRTYEPPDA